VCACLNGCIGEGVESNQSVCHAAIQLSIVTTGETNNARCNNGCVFKTLGYNKQKIKDLFATS